MSDDTPSLDQLEARIDELEDTAEGALRIAQNALQQNSELKSRVDQLEAENDRLEFRVAELELKGETKEDKDYKQLTKPEKRDLIVEDLLRRAEASASGKAKVEYTDVKHGVFDSIPSADHCYTLMDEIGSKPGFTYVDSPAKGNIHLRVDLAEATESLAAKANREFSPAKKEETREAQ